LLTRCPHRSTLFPYTTLFRSPPLPRASGGDARRWRRPRMAPLAQIAPGGGDHDVLGRAHGVDERDAERRARDEDDRRRYGLRARSEEHTSELQSLAYLVCRLR